MQTRIENGMSINVYTPKITKAMVLVIRSKPRFQLMLPVNGWREIAELNEFKYTDEIDCWVMHKKGDENGNLSLLIQKAFLSQPEGTASVVGLIAMMTDHYNVMEGSDSERESNDASVIPKKSQKRKRVKFSAKCLKRRCFSVLVISIKWWMPIIVEESTL
ncbi:hypothetical protein LWI28_015421 [Acer negundo]|uniref:Uncharacterized protein n=1 Tax=Acer negundo TaxID=4023 RepID=A0AAD5J9P5_ACENE|nr:hypothetical protein LWI28_015421 [Acer negundo]